MIRLSSPQVSVENRESEQAFATMAYTVRVNTLDLVHAFFATPRGKVAEAALGDPEMRLKVYELTRAWVCAKYILKYPVDPGAWSSEIRRQVAMYVREFVDQWETVA